MSEEQRGRVTAGEAGRRARVLCLGDALVELVCERPVSGFGDAPAFVPRFGGAEAVAAVSAARLGAPVTLAGGAGADAWGTWLRERLRAEGVDATLFRLRPDVRTPLVLRAGGERLEYGDASEAVLDGAGERLEAAVEDAAALWLTTSWLAEGAARTLVMGMRSRALELGRPVIFRPRLQLGRWRSRADAAASANACVPGALLVCVSRSDAAAMTGEEDPERAAAALIKGGARLVMVTLGEEGAILRGELRGEAFAPAVRFASGAGAGDVLAGVLLGRLALSDFYPPAVAASLREAVVAAARCCERWGALD